MCAMRPDSMLDVIKPPSPASDLDALDGRAHERVHRLRKACDACSIRKVKCDEAGPPCRSCAALDIPCTFERPSRRRGPPNRNAEILRRRHAAAARASSTPKSDTPPISQMSSPLPTLNHYLSAEAIGPIELIELLVDDFFVYNHPLQPFPHAPSFKEDFRLRKDLTDRHFLALLASMVGALVAAYPRRPQQHLKALGKESLFPRSTDLVNRCQKVALEARGPGYFGKPDLIPTDAAISYFLLMMCSYTYRFIEASLYLGECITIIRCLGYHTTPFSTDPASRHKSPNLIEREIGRRLYWTVFVTLRSSKAFGTSMPDIVALNPPTATLPHPPLPLEVDDSCLHANYIETQSQDVESYMVGFNTNVRIYLTLDPLLAMDLSYGIDQVWNWERQRVVLHHSMQAVRAVLQGVPDHYIVWPGPPSRSPSQSTMSHSESLDNTEWSGGSNADFPDRVARRRFIAYEVQKANIHASYLSTRSYLVERYWNHCEARSLSKLSNPHTAPLPLDEIRAERESIVKELLNVLSSVRPVHMEPNSVSFCMKIRQIASTLLPQEPESEHEFSLPAVNSNAANCLQAFLEILTDLEKSGSARGENDSDKQGEEEELRDWADMRASQRLFAERGGGSWM